MKYFFVLTFLSSILVINGQSLNDQLRAALESFRENMPCGYPDSGIPPLAPLDIEHIDLNFDLDGTIQTTGYAENVRITKLNTFVTEFINFSLVPLRIRFTFTFEEVPITGIYDIRGSAAGRYPFRGFGNFRLAAKNMTFNGEANFNTIDGFLNLRAFPSTIKMDDFESQLDNLISEKEQTQEFLNRVLERMVLEMLDIHEATITQAIESFVTPFANSFLNNMTLDDLISGVGSPPEPSEPCIPPESFLTLF